MRGFRGNRAVQNQMSSRYGKYDHPQFKKDSPEKWQYEGQKAKLYALPDWLKTAETKAQEQGVKVEPVAKPRLVLVTKQAEAPKAAAPVAATKPKAKAVAKKVAAKKPRVAKARPAVAKKAAPKRKAA